MREYETEVSDVPLADEGDAETVVVPEDRSETVPYVKDMFEVAPPLGLIVPLRTALVSPIEVGARVVALGEAIGVKERIEPTLVPVELVALARK